MIKGVIFDMDGTMIDTEKLYLKFWIQASVENGYDMKPEHVYGIRSLAAKYAIPKLQESFGDDFDYYKVKNRRIEIMDDYLSNHEIEKKFGLDELLKYLTENGYKKAVATATNLETTVKYLTQLGIKDYFDEIITASMVENGKPAPDIYIKAAEKIGLAPSECLALEDSPNGILSAYRAGCKAVMIPDLTQPDEETMNLLYAKADNLEKVIELLEKTKAR